MLSTARGGGGEFRGRGWTEGRTYVECEYGSAGVRPRRDDVEGLQLWRSQRVLGGQPRADREGRNAAAQVPHEGLLQAVQQLLVLLLRLGVDAVGHDHDGRVLVDVEVARRLALLEPELVEQELISLPPRPRRAPESLPVRVFGVVLVEEIHGVGEAEHREGRAAAPLGLHHGVHSQEGGRERTVSGNRRAEHDGIGLRREGNDHVRHEHVELSLRLPFVVVVQKRGPSMKQSCVLRLRGPVELLGEKFRGSAKSPAHANDDEIA